MLIAVNGHAEKAAPAERGTVRVNVALEARSPADIFRAVSEIHAGLREDAKAYQDDDAVTWWSADQVRTATRQRYLKDSDVLETYYVASAEIQVKFKDFRALAAWIEDITPIEGVAVQHVRWTLTERKRIDLMNRARTSAVQDARARAEAYAKALGFGTVDVRALYEPGLRPSAIGNGYGNEIGAPTTRAAAFGKQPGGSFEMKPEDITLSASITVDFDAYGTAA